MADEKIKETKNDEEEIEETKPKPTNEEIKLNQKLLESDAKIIKLEQEKKALEEAAKEKAFSEILAKKQIKPEFQEFVKFKLQWENVSDLDKAVDDFIKNNPALIKIINTGGNGDTKIDNEKNDGKKNILLDYQKENFL